MLINRKAIKQLAKGAEKQVSKSFLLTLDKMVNELVTVAIEKGKRVKRLTEKELIV